MGFIFGGAPSSFTIPLIEPAVAASTGLPAVAAGVAAGVSDGCPPPQLIIPMAKAIVAEKISNDLLPFMCFLLFRMSVQELGPRAADIRN
jgi:hypothetical protein